MVRSLSLALATTALLTPSLVAQELIDLLPGDFGLCLVVRDLRGEHERLARSACFAHFRASALGKALFESPELARLLRAESELKKALGVGWGTVRDEVLGDEALLAYRPAAPGKSE